MGGKIVCQEDLEQSFADLAQKRARINAWRRLFDSLDSEIGGLGLPEQSENLLGRRIVS